jgi:hypothetical protein
MLGGKGPIYRPHVADWRWPGGEDLATALTSASPPAARQHGAGAGCNSGLKKKAGEERCQEKPGATVSENPDKD